LALTARLAARAKNRDLPRLTPRTCLILVSVLFLLAQLLLVVDVTPLGWDEKVYVGQFSPWSGKMIFTAPRSRGMPLIVAPVLQFTSSMAALRAYLALLSAVGMYVGFGAWLPLRNSRTVALAALMFGSLWTALFYGPSAMPDMPVAFCALAGTAWAVRAARGEPGRRLLLLVFAALALAALIRPADTVQLMVGMCLAVVLLPALRPRRWAVLGAVLGGAAAGALPWIVEAQLRYGGVRDRIHAALHAQSTGKRFVPDFSLRAADGPLLCRPCVRADQPIATWVLAWWVGGALLITVALIAAHRRGHLVELLVPTGVGAIFALPYLLLVGYAAPRFLLPTYALLALPAAGGVGALLLRVPRSWRWAGVALAAAILLVFGHLQLGLVTHATASSRRGAARYARAVKELKKAGVTPPCTTLGEFATPVGFPAGCSSVALTTVGNERFTMKDLRQRVATQHVAVVARPGTAPPPYARGWSRLPSRTYAIWVSP
jgi:hypothetical protein